VNGDGSTLAQFFDAWELFRDPTLAGATAGVLLGFLGVYIVLRRMVFLSAALTQSAGLGVTIAFFLQIQIGLPHWLADPTVGAMAMTIGSSLVLTSRHPSVASRRDALLGWTYLVGAAGTLALGTRIVQEVHDIQTILFGSAVAILPESFLRYLAVAAVLLGLHLWWMRGFVEASFDPVGARVRGVPVAVLDGVLMVTLAVAISVSTRLLGALPVFAFSVLPAMAAVRLASNVPRALAVAAVLGGVAGFGGYVAAFAWSLPVGPTQTLLGAGIVLVAEVVRRVALRGR
jgi:zinc transport system permease protein